MNKFFTQIITLSILSMSFISCSMTPEKTTQTNDTSLEKATFAGGCFWCLEGPFEATPGVIEAISGYAEGTEETADYDQVSSGKTKHKEAVQVTYNPSIVSYEMLVEKFWRQIDPTDPNGQFVDQGPQYKTAIYYHQESQKSVAEKSKEALQDSGLYQKPIATEILPFTTFFPAEEYHQDFYKKSHLRYKTYREASGRDEFINTHTPKQKPSYEKPSEEILKETLTPLQYEVTQHEGTEEPFKNEYWDEKRDGIYVDRVSGEPLFSSTDKYDSGTGWPSFSRPINPEVLTNRTDLSLFVPRTEIRSSSADSHIGHVFNDGPTSTGLRYCTNSASLRFILKEDLEKEGYGEYKKLFE